MILTIEVEHTLDGEDGRPWPPVGAGWHRVRSGAGHSTWRRISISTTTTNSRSDVNRRSGVRDLSQRQSKGNKSDE